MYVYLTLSSPDTGEVTVSTTTITFDNNTWNIPQAITFYGPEDYLLDGDQYTPVSLSFVSSDTTEAIHGISTTITVTTDDSSLGTGFILSDSTPSLREGTTDNSTNFELSSPPKGTVTVTFTSTNDNESIVSPSTLIFTPLNWNIAQPLNLIGVEDFTIDDNQTTQMNISYSSTDNTDGVHNKSDNFNVVTVDSRLTSAFSLSKTPTSTEGSSDNSSTFVLNSKPIDNVTVTFGSKNLQTTGTSAFIYHYNNYDNSFEEQKSILEELGYSVTGSAAYPPAASDIAGVRIVIDFNFSQQCDTSCKNVYDDYIRDGGTLIISGEHNLSSLTQNRNASLQGLLSQLGQTVNLVTASYQGSAYATAAFSLDDGVTNYDGATFSSSTGDTLVERLNGENIWRMWSSSDLPAGYLGRVVLTFDMDQFTRNGDLAFVAAIYRDLVGLAYYTNNEFNFTKTLTFTPDNWNVPQIVTIAGIEDFIVDDNSTTTMNAHMISNDPSYGDYTNTFTVNVIDSRIDVPFIVNPNTPTVAEGTDNSSSTLALQTKPIKNVNVTFTSHDTGEVVTSTTLTFSPDNWSTGQPLTFYGIEDFTQDNNTSTTLTALFSSVDSAISGKSDNFSVINIDSGIMSPFILTTSIPTVIEVQDNNSIGFRLPSRPTSNVTVTFVSGDTGEIRISNLLTFTPDNYSTAQNITLTGIEDFIVDNTSTSIVTAYFSTTDLSYGGMSDNFSVETLDSKITSTFTLIPTTPEVLEGTDNNSSTFVLTSRPKGTVTASFTSDNLSSVTLPYPTMTFTTANWSSPQNITFTGIEDFKNIGNRSTNIQVSYSSTDNTDPIHGRTANFTVTTLDSGLTSAMEASSTPTVIEGGSDNSTTIKLTSPPKQNVSVTLSTQDLASIGKKAVIYYSVSADYSKQRSLLQELGYDVTGSASNVNAALIDGARIVIDLRYNKT